MSARTYTVGNSRVLELPGKHDVTINVHEQIPRHAKISVGLSEPEDAGKPFRPSLAWCMGDTAVLQDDAQNNPLFVTLWLDATVFRVSATYVPALLNFMGPLLRDAREIARRA